MSIINKRAIAFNPFKDYVIFIFQSAQRIIRLKFYLLRNENLKFDFLFIFQINQYYKKMKLRHKLALLFLIKILISSHFCTCGNSEQDSQDSLRLANVTTTQYNFNLTNSINEQANREFYVYLGEQNSQNCKQYKQIQNLIL